MKVYVVPAAYNEKENIEKFITILEEEVFPKIKNHEMHIIVADDNSPDGTGDVVKGLMKKYKNLGINQGPKKGLGAAYVRAMGHAIDKEGAEVVMSIDADLQHDPRSIPDFLEKLEKGYDIVIGTRYSDGGSMPAKWPFQRKLFSVSANILMRLITGRLKIHDWTGGYRAIRREVFQKEKEKVKAYTGYTFQVAFLYKSILDGFKIGEVPIHFEVRREGDSKIAPLAYIVNVLTYVILERIKELLTGSFGKFLIVGGLGFFMQLVVYRALVSTNTLPLGVNNFFSAQLAIFSNYNLNNLWTFKERRAKGIVPYIAKMLGFFATSNIGVIVIQSGIVQLGEMLYGRKFPTVYFLVGTAVLLVWNFSMYSFVIWRKKK